MRRMAFPCQAITLSRVITGSSSKAGSPSSIRGKGTAFAGNRASVVFPVNRYCSHLSRFRVTIPFLGSILSHLISYPLIFFTFLWISVSLFVFVSVSSCVSSHFSISFDTCLSVCFADHLLLQDSNFTLTLAYTKGSMVSTQSPNNL